MRRQFALVLVLGMVVTGCSVGSGRSGARTFYESLDLSSPEATVETFNSAFVDDDFMTVWLTLDWKAQSEINAAFDLLHYSRLVDTSVIPDPGVTLTDPIASLIGRGNLDRWRVFDEVMMVANDHDAFLIDITDLDSITILDETEPGTASLAVTMKGSEDEYIFNLTQGENDRWFIHQVVAPGGDEDSIPWAVAPSIGGE